MYMTDTSIETKRVKVLELLEKGNILAVASELGIPVKSYYMTILEFPCDHISPLVEGLRSILKYHTIRQCPHCCNCIEFSDCVIR